jgi:hypothetical protein
MSSPLDMDDRYGRKRSRYRLLPYAIFLALVGWLFWTGFYHSNPTVTANLLSFKEISEKSMGINFEITRNNPNQDIDCRLTAVDFDKLIVGEVIYRIPAGEKHLKVYAQNPTRARSVSAEVVRCFAAN